MFYLHSYCKNYPFCFIILLYNSSKFIFRWKCSSVWLSKYFIFNAVRCLFINTFPIVRIFWMFPFLTKHKSSCRSRTQFSLLKRRVRNLNFAVWQNSINSELSWKKANIKKLWWKRTKICFTFTGSCVTRGWLSIAPGFWGFSCSREFPLDPRKHWLLLSEVLCCLAKLTSEPGLPGYRVSEHREREKTEIIHFLIP